MDKKTLSKIPRQNATDVMMDLAAQYADRDHMVDAELIEDNKILQLTFYEIPKLIERKPEAVFRTFLSDNDYITQDLHTSKIKWLTASFDYMESFEPVKYQWSKEEHRSVAKDNVVFRSEKDQDLTHRFFEAYADPEDTHDPWTAINRCQRGILEKRLQERHRKETAVIDAVMDPIKKAPKEFFDWIWETGMSFSRYLIYQETEKGKAECECTYCKTIGTVDREKVRLRNNEKGTCPFCGSPVTIKAKGRMPARIIDNRWFLYVDPTPEGFLLRYFKVARQISSDSYLEFTVNKNRIEEWVGEYSRAFYTFPDGKPRSVSYEWGVYKQHGPCRWCPDTGRIACMECILYPGNLPGAWAHTPMKYSALEVLAGNIPTVALRYEDGIKGYIEFPKLEWICKMGLNRLAKDIINSRRYGDEPRAINYSGDTIYKILKLTKINTRILQQVDGNREILALLQKAQSIGLQLQPEQLKDYYETFGVNTRLLEHANRKVTFHRLLKYISREAERYPIGSQSACWRYSYMRYTEREDPRISRKKNMAHDWLEYLDWCRDLGYDLDNMFIYMPTNFKAVHDRTAKEYEEAKDRIEKEKKRRMLKKAEKRMKQTQKALEDLFRLNENADAFSIAGKGLVLVVPKTADDLKREGAILHHCVGTYADKVAEGKTMILFIRKASDPDTPYYTMEYRDDHVVQCRGLRNCDMTPEVKAFTQIFEKKMQDADRKKIRVTANICA